jgi:hypothetical protein
MFDFGDFNPYQMDTHHVKLTAYDADGLQLSSDDLSFTSDTGINPSTGSQGDLQSSGDACSASQGEPGYHQLTVADPQIKKVLLTVVTGEDPNAGFDSISFELDGYMDIKFCSNPNGFNCKRRTGKVPVTIFGGGADGFDVMDIDINTVRLCRADDPSACTGEPISWAYEDRGSPTDIGTDSCAGDRVTLDGYEDLDVKFDGAEITELLGCSEIGNRGSSPDLVVVGEIAGAPFVTNTDHFKINSGGRRIR